MKRVILESPFAGKVDFNIAYARACLRDSLLRGEAPIASHLLYTQKGVLNDDIPEERTLGIEAGLQWLGQSNYTVVYEDLGLSPGMEYGIEKARERGNVIIRRKLGIDINNIII